MRTLAITTGLTLVSGISRCRRFFEDKETNNKIQCSFDSNRECSPDCASCSTSELDTKVHCERIGDKDSLIGILPLKEKK